MARSHSASVARLARVLIEQLSAPDPCPLDELVEDYLRVQSAGVCPAHHSITASRLRRLVARIRSIAAREGRDVQDALDLTSLDCVEYMAQRRAEGRAPATIRGDLVALQAALAWAVKDGRLEVSPLTSLRLPRGGRAAQVRPRARFHPLELGRLIAAAEAIDRREVEWKIPQAPLLVVAIWTGIRLGEQSRLTWGDLDRKRACLRVRAETAKSRRERLLPLRPEALAAIESLVPYHEALLGRAIEAGDPMFRGASRAGSGPVRPNVVWRWFMRVLAEAGLDRRDPAGFVRTWHGLRHAAIDQVAAGNVRAAQLLAGHASVRTTQGYLHEADALVRGAVDALPALAISEPSAVSAASALHGVSDHGALSEPTEGSAEAENGGEGGIRTLGPGFPRHQISNLMEEGPASSPDAEIPPPPTALVRGLAPGSELRLGLDELAALVEAARAAVALGISSIRLCGGGSEHAQ